MTFLFNFNLKKRNINIKLWIFLFLTWTNIVENSLILDEDAPKNGYSGRICGIGDMNKDGYTDIIVQNDDELTIRLQSETGIFSNQTTPKSLQIESTKSSCFVGDFNGDTIPDIISVSELDDSIFHVTVFLFNDVYKFNFTVFNLNTLLFDEPILVDVNGDGITDIVGFKSETRELVCFTGGEKFGTEECTKLFKNNLNDNIDNINERKNMKPKKYFPHIFADFDGDMRADFVFGMENENQKLVLEMYVKNEIRNNWVLHKNAIAKIPNNYDEKNLAAPVVSDFDADGHLDIAFPVCSDSGCKKIEKFLIWSNKNSNRISKSEVLKEGGEWNYITIDNKESELAVTDGYPDLIAVAKINNGDHPIILENVECNGCENVTRKFEMKTTQRLIEPADMSGGKVMLTGFFDLKEDGKLDIVVEYMDKKNQQTKHDFIKCDDKGDTTFLKVQTHTNVCQKECPGRKARDFGSGIPWHGACVSYSMTDSWGSFKVSKKCQLSQTNQRTLQGPYVLFGLGRSPNFIDIIKFDGPFNYKHMVKAKSYELPQIVPNSRIVAVPPRESNNLWYIRLYLTPSRLILQSFIVLAIVCILLLFSAGLLHLRERQQDKREKNSQHQRFFFDAIYKIKDELGRGSFGIVLEVEDIITSTKLAMKIAKKNNDEGRCLVLEKRILIKIRKSNYFPKIYAAGTFKKYNYIICEKLGKNLQSIMHEKYDEKSFHQCVIAEIGYQLIEALTILHAAGYLHRDIKPDNMMIGLPPNDRRIYLIDFGMSRQFKNSDGSLRITKRKNLCFRGTKVFASNWALLNNEQQPWDDIHCVLISLSFMLNGTLPWWESYEDTLKLIKKKSKHTNINMFTRFGNSGKRFALYVLNSFRKYEVDYKYMSKCLRDEKERLDNKTFEAYWSWDLNWTKTLLNPYEKQLITLSKTTLSSIPKKEIIRIK
ncbi:T-cell immunomodulatory protein [Strongyloides ratti]|uniref:T-cell immunomodulatory protein n=1 Tax=Strongyloides ratti TaxID=34506 RepID=A0A090L2B8_STRRB|nr:T-cell immunomodulatory protein [Strongyloides ratti]CEF63832.1 T-cell immunomodulatory protein [Strongyloides ratti]